MATTKRADEAPRNKPIERVHPTPFQRDVSDAHVRKLTRAMDGTRRFLAPIIAVREADGSYSTPNGNHRLTVLKEFGARSAARGHGRKFKVASARSAIQSPPIGT